MHDLWRFRQWCIGRYFFGSTRRDLVRVLQVFENFQRRKSDRRSIPDIMELADRKRCSGQRLPAVFQYAAIQRYIRLTELSPELQQMVNEKKIGMTPAVEISYLKPEEQQMLLTAIDSEQATPSLSQAQRTKTLSREGKLKDDSMLSIS